MSEPTPADFERLAELRQEDFEPYLGQDFSCPQLENRFRLEEIVDLGRARDPRQPRVPFSLLFRHPTALPQQIYPLHREGLGCLPVFLVPVGQTDGVFLYEAVFH